MRHHVIIVIAMVALLLLADNDVDAAYSRRRAYTRRRRAYTRRRRAMGRGLSEEDVRMKRIDQVSKEMVIVKGL